MHTNTQADARVRANTQADAHMHTTTQADGHMLHETHALQPQSCEAVSVLLDATAEDRPSRTAPRP